MDWGVKIVDVYHSRLLPKPTDGAKSVGESAKSAIFGGFTAQDFAITFPLGSKKPWNRL